MRNKQCGRYAKWFGQSKKTQFRPTAPSCTPVHWMTTITLEDADLRPRLMAFLSSEGIDSRQMIFPVHDAAHFQEEFGQSSFPVATDISYRSLHLPSGTGLQDHEIDHIAETTLDWLEKNG
ncbi:MAG: DegT/DnrJ/EryC1/StrS family aminotransferase [Desulfobacterales bacterium]|nr:DegT/DnrJ/EryC1/StrS family aminotransferase [Desulfobacterales bacterium]